MKGGVGWKNNKAKGHLKREKMLSIHVNPHHTHTRIHACPLSVFDSSYWPGNMAINFTPASHADSQMHCLCTHRQSDRDTHTRRQQQVNLHFGPGFDRRSCYGEKDEGWRVATWEREMGNSYPLLLLLLLLLMVASVSERVYERD